MNFEHEAPSTFARINQGNVKKFHLKQAANSLIQASESLRLNASDSILVQRQNLQRIQALESPIVDDRNFIVIEIENQQMMQILQGARRNILQLVLRHVKLRQPLACCRANKKKMSEKCLLQLERGVIDDEHDLL